MCGNAWRNHSSLADGQLKGRPRDFAVGGVRLIVERDACESVVDLVGSDRFLFFVVFVEGLVFGHVHQVVPCDLRLLALETVVQVGRGRRDVEVVGRVTTAAAKDGVAAADAYNRGKNRLGITYSRIRTDILCDTGGLTGGVVHDVAEDAGRLSLLGKLAGSAGELEAVSLFVLLGVEHVGAFGAKAKSNLLELLVRAVILGVCAHGCRHRIVGREAILVCRGKI